ncbi:MAG TPA: glycosyltransferase family 2 protein [Planctomycetota bacterium]|jgi:glycosyltransferase involved in cell wall biosynthesis|nr:glycosyltransferase family 2 protein [Planctomycetota bacterium]
MEPSTLAARRPGTETRPAAPDRPGGKRTRVRRVSVVLPACDEEAALPGVLARLAAALAPLREEGYRFETIVVDDGSRDRTAELAEGAGARVLHHSRRLGNGAAVKRGAREADGELLVFLDADGQHPPEEIPRLLQALESNDLAVGARRRPGGSWTRRLGNGALNLFASCVTGRRIPDLTSGFRAARAEAFRRFLYLLPNEFSYPTTSTLAFLRAGLAVAFVPVEDGRDAGTSHVRPLQDGAKFFLILVKVATIFSPLRVFVPSAAAIAAGGFANYLYTYWTQGRFTNMSVLMFTLAAIMFALGLVSEQIAALRFERSEADDERR